MNLLEILRKVQLKLGRQFDIVGNESVIQDILDGYRDICIKNNWSFFLKEGRIHVYAYKKLTAAAWTNSTKVLTVDEAITAEDAAIYAGHRCYVPDSVDSVGVSAVTSGAAGAASITLLDAPQVPDNGDAKVIPTTDVGAPALSGSTITCVDHGYEDGEPVVYNNGGGASITGLVSGTTYCVYASTDDTFKLTAVPNTLPALIFTTTGNDKQYFRKVGIADGDTIYLYLADYALPSDCAFNKEISIIDRILNRRIAKVVEPTFSKATKFDYFTFDSPRAYMAKSREYRASTDNSNYIMFWPFLNPTEKNLSVWYFRKPFGNFDTFTYTGGTTAAHLLPEIPEEFAHLLEWMALEQAYLKLGDSRLGYAMQKKWDIFKELLDANNGDIAMEHILKESPPLGYEGMPDFNTINVRIV